MKQWIRNLPKALLLAICLSALSAISYLGMKELQKERTILDMEKELVDDYTEPVPESSQDPFLIDWNGLLQANPDVIGWIQFPNPDRINYPIVQGRNNRTYLNHDWRGRYQPAGAIFLHKANDPSFRDQNSVIYGHRMMGGSMFGSLGKFGSEQFLNENPYFFIYTPDGKKRIYEIFAYAKVRDGSNAYELHFTTTESRKQYYQDIRKQAITIRDLDLDEFDTTVTLSTCANRGYYTRMILQGKLIKIEIKGSE